MKSWLALDTCVFLALSTSSSSCQALAVHVAFLVCVQVNISLARRYPGAETHKPETFHMLVHCTPSGTSSSPYTNQTIWFEHISLARDLTCEFKNNFSPKLKLTCCKTLAKIITNFSELKINQNISATNDTPEACTDKCHVCMSMLISSHKVTWRFGIIFSKHWDKSMLCYM